MQGETERHGWQDTVRKMAHIMAHRRQRDLERKAVRDKAHNLKVCPKWLETLYNQVTPSYSPQQMRKAKGKRQRIRLTLNFLCAALETRRWCYGDGVMVPVDQRIAPSNPTTRLNHLSETVLYAHVIQDCRSFEKNGLTIKRGRVASVEYMKMKRGNSCKQGTRQCELFSVSG